MIKLGSAHCDENSKYKGGSAGDQTGKEVSTQDFYVHKKGWYVFRPKNIIFATKIADAMDRACKNDNIGYNQSERNQIIKYGIDTKIKCNCDCSSLVRACIKDGTGVLLSNFSTASECKVLEKSGLFIKYVYYKNMPLFNGDILVTQTKGHTGIITTGAPRTEKANAFDYVQIAKEIIRGKWGSGRVRKEKLKAAGIDYEKAQAEVNKIMRKK